MQFTAFSMADLWKDGLENLYLYELTKSNKVIKHKIKNLIEFEGCVIVAIGADKDRTNHKLIFSQGSGTKRILGDSMFYTDFAAIKSKFNSKFGLKELKEEIAQLEIDAKQANDILTTRRFKLERLLVGMKNMDLEKLDEDDKIEKDFITEHLKKTIYHYASRYGTDLTFTFLIDRIFSHAKHSFETKESMGLHYDKSTIEELQTILNDEVKLNPTLNK